MAQASTTVIAHGRAAAWNSYTKLAARLGADPVALAEADVLGELYDAVDEMACWIEYVSDITGKIKPQEIKTRAYAVLAKCRQKEPTDA